MGVGHQGNINRTSQHKPQQVVVAENVAEIPKIQKLVPEDIRR